MQYDFLKAFPKRMKCVGLHAMLQANSSQKSIWRQMGFEGLPEQMNMIFSVLLFIMEQSLKEEICTMDNIATFIDSINGLYYRKSLDSDDCYELGDFIVNVVLSNEGKPMFFAARSCDNQETSPWSYQWCRDFPAKAYYILLRCIPKHCAEYATQLPGFFAVGYASS